MDTKPFWIGADIDYPKDGCLWVALGEQLGQVASHPALFQRICEMDRGSDLGKLRRDLGALLDAVTAGGVGSDGAMLAARSVRARLFVRKYVVPEGGGWVLYW